MQHNLTETCIVLTTLIMAALRSRCGHYYFVLWFLLSSYFFSRLFSAVAGWMSAILPHMVWPYATLGCRSETLGIIPHSSYYLFDVIFTSFVPLPSNRHHRRYGDCLEGKGENYHVCSVQYCVQQLCTVRCTHI